MLTSHDNQEEIISSLASGANAYALKEISVEDLHDAILNTYKNEKVSFAEHLCFLTNRIILCRQATQNHCRHILWSCI